MTTSVFTFCCFFFLRQRYPVTMGSFDSYPYCVTRALRWSRRCFVQGSTRCVSAQVYDLLLPNSVAEHERCRVWALVAVKYD